MFDDVSGRRPGREKAELVSVRTRATMAIRQMYNMPGASFAFGKPTLAEISLKMSIICVEWDSSAVSLITSVVAFVADRKLE